MFLFLFSSVHFCNIFFFLFFCFSSSGFFFILLFVLFSYPSSPFSFSFSSSSSDTSIGPLLQILKEEQACNDTITHLDLSFNTFGSFSVKHFDPFLFSQTYLQTLNLGSALLKLKPKFRALLFQSISKHCNSLIHLSLPSNNLNNMDAIQLSTILKLNKCSKLNVLNLAWNSITGDGIQAIAESLLTNNSLKTLNLNYNTSGNSARYEREKIARCVCGLVIHSFSSAIDVV